VFRDGIGTSNLAYGAAYYPYLQTSLSYAYADADITIQDGAAAGITLAAADSHELCQAALAQCKKLGDRFAIFDVKQDAATDKKDIDVFRDGIGTSNLAYGAAYYPYLQTSLSYAYADADVTIQGGAAPGVTLDTIKSSQTATYQQVKARLTAERVVLPPSAAVAGIYASVDRDRGVWKAPANVSVSAVIGPVLKITNEAQDALNVDPTAGKSINAVRAFTGRGTIVWGARTLAGNDNEWRYIPVRRLFIMIEESARKASAFAVFEPNDMTTWLKVKGMIESFLYGLWERGALAGASPEAAYFVNVGLGKTMTSQDILEGRMIVEIGIASVRPAEFIVLRFSHKLQEA
jgi:phage tail sheath protein FI